MMKNVFIIFPLTLCIAFFTLSCGTDKSSLLTRAWEANELMLGETTLSAAEIGEVIFTYNADNSFTYSEPSAPVDKGTWRMAEDGTVVITFKDGGREVVQTILEISSSSLTLEYEDHGMKRKLVLVPKQ